MNTIEAEFVLAIPKKAGQSKRDSFEAGLDKAARNNTMLSQLTLLSTTNSPAPSLAPPPLFGLYVELRVFFMANQFTPLSADYRDQLEGMWDSTTKAIKSGRVSQATKDLLWKAFEQGPGLAMPTEFATRKSVLFVQSVYKSTSLG